MPIKVDLERVFWGFLFFAVGILLLLLSFFVFMVSLVFPFDLHLLTNYLLPIAVLLVLTEIGLFLSGASIFRLFGFMRSTERQKVS